MSSKRISIYCSKFTLDTEVQDWVDSMSVSLADPYLTYINNRVVAFKALVNKRLDEVFDNLFFFCLNDLNQCSKNLGAHENVTFYNSPSLSSYQYIHTTLGTKYAEGGFMDEMTLATNGNCAWLVSCNDGPNEEGDDIGVYSAPNGFYMTNITWSGTGNSYVRGNSSTYNQYANTTAAGIYTSYITGGNLYSRRNGVLKDTDAVTPVAFPHQRLRFMGATGDINANKKYNVFATWKHSLATPLQVETFINNILTDFGINVY